MLLLQKSATNTIVVTLDELKSDELPNYWLFVFELEQDDNYTYKKQFTDSSLFPSRYNKFSLVEGTDITFKFLGDYKYTVYQMPNAVSTDITDGLLCETGKMRLVETITPIPTFEVNNLTTIYDAYNIS